MEFRISDFENCCSIVKQISIGLERKVRVIDYYIAQKRTLFSDEVLDLSVSAFLIERE